MCFYSYRILYSALCTLHSALCSTPVTTQRPPRAHHNGDEVSVRKQSPHAHRAWDPNVVCSLVSSLSVPIAPLPSSHLSPPPYTTHRGDKQYGYVRDMTSIFAALTWGNIFFHGADNKIGNKGDNYPMNAMAFRMLEETMDALLTFPDTPQGRKDRATVYEVRPLRAVWNKTKTLPKEYAYAKTHEYVVKLEAMMQGEPTAANYGKLQWQGHNDIPVNMPRYSQVFPLIFFVRILAVFHPSRVAFGAKMWQFFYGLMSPL